MQINFFLKENNVLKECQSGFRTNYSTETALTKIISDLSENKVSVLILFDQSTAFNMTDHVIVLDRLELSWSL